MYLSKLELHGFKSFADRTAVNFAPGVTVVVGPNGCGKSNIVDAVRWVIGEQRARILRSEKMENVIFNGAGGRKALGVAEVMLTIENNRGVLPTEYSEVTIGRRLYRSGDSEYLLNGTQCRLKDITDLFMDTGMGAGAYSVIELKMIEELLSDNALDRRRLFEEAAGITKYKIRRSQTLRKLEGTQVDLTRVRDLTEELDKRVRSLERQAKKAGRFKEYRDRLRLLELALAQTEYDRLFGESTSATEARGKLKDILEQDTARLAASEADHEALRTRHIEREQVLVVAQTRLSAQIEKLRAAQSDERLVRERLGVAERDMERLTREQASAVVRGEMLAESLANLHVSVATAQPAAEEAESALDIARQKRDSAVAALEAQRRRVQAARQEERLAAEGLAEIRRTLDRSSSRIEVMQEDLAGLDERESRVQDKLALAERTAEESKVTHDRIEQEVAQARQTVEDAARQKEVLGAEVAEKRDTLHAAQRRMDAVKAEVALLESLLASFDDFSDSVQFLASDRDWTDQALVTVADVISCDAPDQQAVEAALGDFASCLVVASDQEAHRAIGKLRASGKGRATFLVLDRLPALEPARTPSPEAIPLLDLIRTEAQYQRLAGVLLGDSFVVDTLDAALDLSGRGGRFFSRTGEWVSRGVVCGGSGRAGKAGSARLGRREQLDAAQLAASAAEKEVEQAREAMKVASGKLEAVGLVEAEKALRMIQSQVSTAQSAQSRASLERDNLLRQTEEIRKRRGDLELSVENHRKDISEWSEAAQEAEARVKRSETERTKYEEAFQGLDTASRQAIGAYSEAKVNAVQARNNFDNASRDLLRVEAEIVRLDQEKQDRAERLERLEEQRVEATDRIAFLETALDDLELARADMDREVMAAKDSLSEIKVAISNLEAVLRDLRRVREQHLQEDNQLSVRLANLEARQESLVATIVEDYEIDLTGQRTERPEGFVLEEAQAEVQDLRGRIRGLGPVNELALETFEEEQERLHFLQTQLKDLEHAESTLMQTITEINTTASERFETTFAAIQANFSRLFEDLFGEDANARVVLQDENDPLESDIEIFAKPRGKKPSVLAQLSGGEKTLTAIALLFAIYLVKPSPFCILDEVDAPLDDANVDRFMDLIRSFSESTQFVLVTHNKRTMEAADRMYGITMQQQGVSRLVGVEFDSALELVA